MRHSGDTQRTTTLSPWRLVGVPVLGPEGGWGRETAPGCCRAQGVRGRAQAGRPAAAVRALRVAKHGALCPPY